MARPASALKAPGPPWLHPLDTLKVVRALASLGTIDLERPLHSRLLLKPLDPADGGLTHTGGTLFGKADPAYDDFAIFLAGAATCLVWSR